jgi:hypothetical protein
MLGVSSYEVTPGFTDLADGVGHERADPSCSS